MTAEPTAGPEVLVAEHDPAVAELIRRYLAGEGLRVRSARTAAQTVTGLSGAGAAAAVLDLTMPGLDAREIRRLIRGGATAPVVCLTAGEGTHSVPGLRPQDVGVGQDACLARPFGPRTLAAKVRAAVRGGQPPAATTYTAGRLRVEPARRRTTLDGVPVALTGTEFGVLVCLLRSAGRTVPRRALRAAVWGEDAPGTGRIVDVYIAQLRAKLGPGHGIRTVRGIGYVLDTVFAPPERRPTALPSRIDAPRCVCRAG